MPVVFGLGSQWNVTLLTIVRSLPLVISQHVFAEVGALSEAGLALSALVRKLSSVDQHVAIQTLSSCELFVADIALRNGSQLVVLKFVPLCSRRRGIDLSTDITLRLPAWPLFSRIRERMRRSVISILVPQSTLRCRISERTKATL